MKNRAKNVALANFYVEQASKYVSDVTADDYKAFLSFVESTEKDIVINPITFSSYLTGIEKRKMSLYFLGYKEPDGMFSKRQSLVAVN